MKPIHLLALGLMFVAAPAAADPPSDLAAKVEALRKQVGATGVSIAIVEGGRTTLARGWGERKLGDKAKVDAHTIFQTGSTGKAFTSAALAILVDRGKLKWTIRWSITCRGSACTIRGSRGKSPSATCSSIAAASASARAI